MELPEIPKFPCNDCGVNTIPLEGNREYYEVQDMIWEAVWPNSSKGQEDNGPEGHFLCIGCLEKRLGRMLVRGDFKQLPANNPSPWYSDRLNSRLILESRDMYAWPQWHPNALTQAVHSVHGYETYHDGAGALTSPRYTPLPDAIINIPNAKFTRNGIPWQEKSGSAEVVTQEG